MAMIRNRSLPARPRHMSIRRWLRRQHVGIGVLSRFTGYAALWWIISGGDGGWLWGIPAVLIAALFNPFPGSERWHWRLRGLLVFVPVFVWLSLRSAFDVAWRALHPARPLDPALIDVAWSLDSWHARLFFANLINLMPGTLCVRITEQGMTVHCLGRTEQTLAGLQRLETVIGNLFRSEESPHE